jgi:hypothetical protein
MGYRRNNAARMGPRDESYFKVYAAVGRSRAVFYTTTVGVTLRELRQHLRRLTSRSDICIEERVRPAGGTAGNALAVSAPASERPVA